MRKKKIGSIWSRLLLLVLVLAAIFGAYYLGFQRALNEKGRGFENMISSSESGVSPASKGEVKAPIVESAETSQGRLENESSVEGVLGTREERCEEIERDVREFFKYLDERPYVQHLGEGISSYTRFRRILKRLSASPPIPAGEGIDSITLAKNIFHFFRVLDKEDLRLIKEIMRNEGDTLEMNLDLFYRWLMLGNRCPDPKGIRPSLGVLYKYAGFFLNTIGGRAYLFRRPSAVRILVSYYSLLIIHEADKKGINNYGVDVFPYIAPLKEEMSFYPGFLFQKEYLTKLDELTTFYLKRR
ncbi:MAG: hypothetical protein JRJ78_00380 [Deltaproteobacteria bacterium]|nr:hypothetical protein [Deltaproteobacteria bacterium]MBW2015518.1 hypothetical protein [Deltaproteobacteria bacterium]